jgi:hypothetical protein
VSLSLKVQAPNPLLKTLKRPSSWRPRTRDGHKNIPCTSFVVGGGALRQAALAGEALLC